MIDSINIVLVGIDNLDEIYLKEVLGIDDYMEFTDEEGNKGYSFTYRTVEFKYYLYGNLVVETTTHKILNKKDITLSDNKKYKFKLEGILREVLNSQKYKEKLLTQIDYCADIEVGEEKLEEIVKVMNKHCSSYKHKKRRRTYETSIQLYTKSGKLVKGYDKVACIKDKAKDEINDIIYKYKGDEIKNKKLQELNARVKEEIALYKGVIRLEISVRKENLKYYYKESIKKMKQAKKDGKTNEEINKIKIEYRTIDNYWTEEKMYNQFLAEVKQYYYGGDYYKLSIAINKIKDAENYTNLAKNKLIIFLSRIKCVGIDRVKKCGIYSKGTIRNYIKQLTELGINPIVIDEDSEYDMLESLYTLAVKQAEEKYFK